jgi:hypothetical protein
MAAAGRRTGCGALALIIPTHEAKSASSKPSSYPVYESPTICFLIIEHAGAEYMDELFINDATFCSEIYKVLLRHCSKTIQEIGDIDLSDTR